MSEHPPHVADQDCPVCRIAVGAGMALNICNAVFKEKVDCKKLEKDLLDGVISEDELYEALLKAADEAKEADVKADIEEIVRLAKGGKVDS